MMKKRNLKTLGLNKKSISNLQLFLGGNAHDSSCVTDKTRCLGHGSNCSDWGQPNPDDPSEKSQQS